MDIEAIKQLMRTHPDPAQQGILQAAAQLIEDLQAQVRMLQEEQAMRTESYVHAVGIGAKYELAKIEASLHVKAVLLQQRQQAEALDIIEQRFNADGVTIVVRDPNGENLRRDAEKYRKLKSRFSFANVR
ncbi:hypothetical protein [Noviherbaspirillum galbum]|uniref:Uncharacterized protein n=1 Tax=Noviherbaspirillum galbum TaxID=2709383 RepID=A0A6B3SP64_9BURK|nr:hypothetical protein [Noviherbaspirillum galbum]NEX59509.1 hypothetical protein [Noviherbaspirillum galbum]